MVDTTILPPDDTGKLSLLQHFANTLPRYADILGLSPNELAQITSAAVWFKFALDFEIAAKAYTLGAELFKKRVLEGQPFGLLALPLLNLPTPPSGEPFLDITGFLNVLIVRIRLHAHYSEAIGVALNLPPMDLKPLDLDTVQPELSVEILGGHPNIHWAKNGLDELEMEVDRGEGTFTPLIIAPIPDFLDIAPLPSPGKSAVWRYRAIYRMKEQRVGNWSSVLEVMVKGGDKRFGSYPRR